MAPRRTGRPPLDPNYPTIQLSLSLPSKRYDELYAQARAERMSMSEFVRRLLRQDFRNLKSTPKKD
jgi:hypothetical protein